MLITILLRMINFFRNIISFFTVKRLLFSEPQREILDTCKNSNREEYRDWFLANLIFPLIVIASTIAIVILFSTKNPTLVELLFNGRFSLIGINILFGMSSYIIKYDLIKNPQVNTNAIYLRNRLSRYTYMLIFVGSIMYIIQNLFTDFSANDYATYFIVCFTILTFIFSLYIAVYMYIIKDEFMKKTIFYDQKVSNDVKDLRGGLSEYLN